MRGNNRFDRAQAEGDRFNKRRRRQKSPSVAAIPVYDSQSPRISASGKLMVCVVLGTATVLSQQVWLSYGDSILDQINRVPFLTLAEMLPFIGGVVRFVKAYFPDLLGVGIWAMINGSQSGRDIIKLFGIRDPWWVDQLTHWSQPQYVAIAYCLEFALNYDRYPIYPGGIMALWDNLSAFNFAEINWLNIVPLLISILSFEWLVRFFTVKAVKGSAKNGPTRTA